MGLLLAAALVSCAPAAQRAAPAPLQAAFSPLGVLWVEGGRASVARAPDFRPVAVALPGAAAVGWQTTASGSYLPWVGVPSAGIIVTADGVPDSVQVGRVVALSSTRVYREDGSAVDFAGGARDGVVGTPSAVVTGGDGADYALVNARLYRAAATPLQLDGAARPRLYATLSGAASANVPTVQTLSGLYDLTGTLLERRDAAGSLIASVPHGPGLVGAVGDTLVTVAAGGRLRFFAPDLRELKP